MYGKKPGPGYSLKRCSKRHSVNPIHKHVPGAPTTKAFMPKSVKGSDHKIFEVFGLRPAGQWSSDFLNSETGRQLVESHWTKVQHILMAAAKKSKLPMSKKEVEGLLKKQCNSQNKSFSCSMKPRFRGHSRMKPSGSTWSSSRNSGPKLTKASLATEHPDKSPAPVSNRRQNSSELQAKAPVTLKRSPVTAFRKET